MATTKRIAASMVAVSEVSHCGFSMSSRTTSGRGIEPTMEAGNSGSEFIGSGLPQCLGEIHVFLRVDLAVLARRVGVTEGDAALDHVLEHVDQVRLLEDGRLAIGLVPVLCFAAMIEVAELPCARAAELGNADELP